MNNGIRKFSTFSIPQGYVVPQEAGVVNAAELKKRFLERLAFKLRSTFTILSDERHQIFLTHKMRWFKVSVEKDNKRGLIFFEALLATNYFDELMEYLSAPSYLPILMSKNQLCSDYVADYVATLINRLEEDGTPICVLSMKAVVHNFWANNNQTIKEQSVLRLICSDLCPVNTPLATRSHLSIDGDWAEPSPRQHVKFFAQDDEEFVWPVKRSFYKRELKHFGNGGNSSDNSTPRFIIELANSLEVRIQIQCRLGELMNMQGRRTGKLAKVLELSLSAWEWLVSAEYNFQDFDTESAIVRMESRIAMRLQDKLLSRLMVPQSIISNCHFSNNNQLLVEKVKGLMLKLRFWEFRRVDWPNAAWETEEWKEEAQRYWLLNYDVPVQDVKVFPFFSQNLQDSEVQNIEHENFMRNGVFPTPTLDVIVKPSSPQASITTAEKVEIVASSIKAPLNESTDPASTPVNRGRGRPMKAISIATEIHRPTRITSFSLEVAARKDERPKQTIQAESTGTANIPLKRGQPSKAESIPAQLHCHITSTSSSLEVAARKEVRPKQTNQAESSGIACTPLKRGRGRPSKAISIATELHRPTRITSFSLERNQDRQKQTDEVHSTATDSTPLTRGRGRPSKAASIPAQLHRHTRSSSTSVEVAARTQHRERGRTLKRTDQTKRTASPSTSIKNERGRPKKNYVISAEKNHYNRGTSSISRSRDSEGMKQTNRTLTPKTTAKRGRPRKRSRNTAFTLKLRSRDRPTRSKRTESTSKPPAKRGRPRKSCSTSKERATSSTVSRILNRLQRTKHSESKPRQTKTMILCCCSTATGSTPVNRGRGRPRKAISIPTELHRHIRSTSSPLEVAESNRDSLKRGNHGESTGAASTPQMRGRPSKAISIPSQLHHHSSSSSFEVALRNRDRPKRTNQVKSTDTASTPVTRERGRPSRAISIPTQLLRYTRSTSSFLEAAARSQDGLKRTDQVERTVVATTPLKRTRGRPRKNSSISISDTRDTSSTSRSRDRPKRMKYTERTPSPPMKRGRGRPRKQFTC